LGRCRSRPRTRLQAPLWPLLAARLLRKLQVPGASYTHVGPHAGRRRMPRSGNAVVLLAGAPVKPLFTIHEDGASRVAGLHAATQG